MAPRRPLHLAPALLTAGTTLLIYYGEIRDSYNYNNQWGRFSSLLPRNLELKAGLNVGRKTGGGGLRFESMNPIGLSSRRFYGKRKESAASCVDIKPSVPLGNDQVGRHVPIKTRVTLEDVPSDHHLNESIKIFDQFLGWARDNGAQGLNNLRVYVSEDGERGVVFEQDMKRKAKLVRIPIDLMLTDQLAPNDPLMYESISWDVRLAVKLCRELKKPNSFWLPYLKTLPHIPYLPSFWDSEERQMLEYRPLVSMLESLSETLDDAYYNLEARNADMTVEEFRWAWFIAQSRAFAFETNLGMTYALVPFADLFNHGCEEELTTHGDSDPNIRANLLNPSMNTVWKVRKDKLGRLGFEMRLIKDVESEMQGLICYAGGEGGTASNDILMMNYGFASGANDADDVTVFRNMAHLIEWYLSIRPLEAESKVTATQLGETVMQAGSAFQRSLVNAGEIDADFFKTRFHERMSIMQGGELDSRLLVAFANLESARNGDPVEIEMSKLDMSVPKRLLTLRFVDILYKSFRTPVLRDLAILAGEMFDADKWDETLRDKEHPRYSERLDRIHYSQLRFGMERALKHLKQQGIVPNEIGGYLKDANGVYEDLTPVRFGSNQWKAVLYRAHKKMILVNAILGYSSS